MVAKIFDLLMKEHDLHLGDNPHLYVLPHDQITKTAATIKVDDTRSRDARPGSCQFENQNPTMHLVAKRQSYAQSERRGGAFLSLVSGEAFPQCLKHFKEFERQIRFLDPAVPNQ
jgi:hypothetical protein